MDRKNLDDLLRAGRVPEALAAACAWTVAEARSIPAWQYRTQAELWLGDLVAAEASARRVLDLSPGLWRGEFNLACVLMGQGRYREAWPLYESRYATDPARQAGFVRFPFPAARQWHGEPLAGRRLLLVQEQGFGDQIQFIRLAAELAGRGAGEVLLHCSPALAPVLESASGVDRVYGEVPRGEAYDLWTPLLSLPLLLGLEGAPPTAFPYLQAPAARVAFWRGQLDGWANGNKRFGLAWSGSPDNTMNPLRSLALAQVYEIAAARGRALPVSLQLGDPGFEDLGGQCMRGIVPLLDMLPDFGETAAAITALDLVITVDTAVAHLAAALGKPVWILLPGSADWRWGRAGSSTPWYPQARLFRQHTLGDWSPVIREVAQELAAWAQT